MFARELVKRRFAFVTADADLDYVAKLLSESGVGAVPVVNDNLEPIGIVTRSDLEPARPAPSVEVGPIPEFLLRNRVSPSFRPDGRALRDVMTAPAISVPGDALLTEVAQLMTSRRLKRAPVIDGHKIVGVLLLREVMRAIADTRPAPDALQEPKPILSLAPPEPAYCDVATATEFRELVAAHARQLDAERDQRRHALHEAREQRIKEFAARRLSDGQWRDMLAQSRRAAASGQTEHLLIRFPSQLCADGGRAINAPDAHWPETLRGEPADVFRRWRNELHPRGFKIAAQIVDFPEGMPGDAALFLIWGKSD
jgi:CBS domain-containing protein